MYRFPFKTDPFLNIPCLLRAELKLQEPTVLRKWLRPGTNRFFTVFRSGGVVSIWNFMETLVFRCIFFGCFLECDDFRPLDLLQCLGSNWILRCSSPDSPVFVHFPLTQGRTSFKRSYRPNNQKSIVFFARSLGDSCLLQVFVHF